MKYAMLSTLIPDELNMSFHKHSKNTMQDAANALQWNIYYGFCENLKENIPLFNVLPVGSFPQFYDFPLITKSFFSKNGINIGFCNIKLLRNYLKPRKIYKCLRAWCKSDSEPKTLFIYTISQPFLKAVNKLKKHFPNILICAIVADLPDMSNLSSKKSLLQKVYIKKQATNAYKKLNCVDTFVLLTKNMADYMHIHQPYCVMEGIASNTHLLNDSNGKCELNDENYNVLYTGTLHRKFGVLHLVDAFRKIPDSNFRLYICGTGDSENDIQKITQKDSRIIYLGQLSRESVLKLQQNATLLVNPRLNNEEFTKYSFPSKTMEYLASGVPVVAYKLDGIPKEYDSYISYPKDNSTDTLANTIYEHCKLAHDVRKNMGLKARKFVLDNKNAIVQSKRILDFVAANTETQNKN